MIKLRPHSVKEVSEIFTNGISEDGQRLGGVVEQAAAVGGDDHQILDAHAEAAGQVDAGLDGEAHALLNGQRAAGDVEGLLVVVDADAVAGAMGIEVAVAGAADDVHGGLMDLGDERPGRTADSAARLASSTTS